MGKLRVNSAVLCMGRETGTTRHLEVILHVNLLPTYKEVINRTSIIHQYRFTKVEMHLRLSQCVIMSTTCACLH